MREEAASHDGSVETDRVTGAIVYMGVVHGHVATDRSAKEPNLTIAADIIQVRATFNVNPVGDDRFIPV
ncbi:hypothetical protein EBM89_03855 [Cellulomonas triticagri]|uniref:Uncharacterized protein n=1 Tax=Cellulomonas triticagri TaxID=2483352 RepID=A0A3M2JS45_9CELL|nr:hypothetical protein EBM89_03855 [Cellulomonas triticagri]